LGANSGCGGSEGHGSVDGDNRGVWISDVEGVESGCGDWDSSVVIEVDRGVVAF
jgi:hypothetical protein